MFLSFPVLLQTVLSCGTKNYLYHFHTISKNFQKARDYCMSLNGDLAMPKTDDEQSCIDKMTTGYPESWIGIGRLTLSNSTAKSSFIYLDGTSLYADRWVNGQSGKSNTFGPCVSYRRPSASPPGWDDDNCAHLHTAVCQLNGQYSSQKKN